MATKKALIICPRCKSTKVAPHAGGRHGIKHGAIFEATYTEKVCENCGFTGRFFPEISKEHFAKRKKGK